MKKLIALLTALTLLLCFASCGTNDTTDATNSADTTVSSDGNAVSTPTADALLSDGELNTGMKEKFDQMEYAAYCDLFYNDNGASYDGKTFTKDGTFAILKDAYSNVTRYYVWGYADNTKCCDYQWEIVMPEGTEIPEPGSYIEVKGTMEKHDDALDGYRLTDITLTVKEEFTNAGFDIDFTTMSPTLTRVQVINILQFPENFAKNKVRLFGRALTVNTIQHPYYNESWTMHFTETDTVPSIGDYIVVEGVYNNSGSENIITTDKLTVIG